MRSDGSESAEAQRDVWDIGHFMHGHSRTRGDANGNFHPP